MFSKMLAYLGRVFLSLLRELGELALLLVDCLRWLPRPPYRIRNFFKQLDFIGVRSLFIVTLTGLFTGMVLALHTGYALRPGIAESALLLWRRTGDPVFRDQGKRILKDVVARCRTEFGYVPLLDLKTGDALLLTVSRDSDVPTDTLFAHRERERAAHTLRLTVKSVLPDAGVGSLRLDAQPGTPRNVFLDRDWLAGQLQRAGRINTIVAGAQEEGGAPEAASQSASRVPAALERAMNLDDYGLKLSPSDEGYISVHSERILLSDRERPRAFWVFAVLSRARPYHLSKPTQSERPRAFKESAVLSRAAASAPSAITHFAVGLIPASSSNILSGIPDHSVNSLIPSMKSSNSEIKVKGGICNARSAPIEIPPEALISETAPAIVRHPASRMNSGPSGKCVPRIPVSVVISISPS